VELVIMNLRLYPGMVFVLLAGLFFLAVSRRVTLARDIARGNRLRALLALSAAGGIAGAILAGRLVASKAGSPTVAFSLPLVSFGGYWGALGAGALAAIVLRLPVLRVLDALTWGVAAGGAVARLNCLFTGCCLGAWPWGRAWPLLDAAALLAVIGLNAWRVAERRRPGIELCTFLSGYAVLRAILERMRAPGVGGAGLAFAAGQLLLGIVLMGFITRRYPRPATPENDA